MFTGSIPALVTPFTNGEVDKQALKELVEWHIEMGSSGVVPVGTTGETPTLSHEEHREVVRICVETAAGRIPVIAGAGSNSTREATSLTQFAQDIGASAALVVTPYYNKPTQRGLLAHFEGVLESTDIPIIIYNIPGRSIVDMSPETMGALAKHKNIVGVKDATGDVARVSHQRATCGEDFCQLSGEDASALGFNAHGGVGCISVTANVAPKLCAEFQAATLAGDYPAALAIQDRLLPLHTALFVEPGVAGAKYALSLLGKCNEDVRRPLTTLLDETKAQIKAAMQFANLL
ncbi:MAG TPA: 4-hydroxy-tetrahydrodipicolinate synthase [Rhodobacteraceae bacterium]|nr:4-hydroxy-tetrahydrodipicolinate synthase [Paracoccaceae bacterium]